jgi:hypothetical protein
MNAARICVVHIQLIVAIRSDPIIARAKMDGKDRIAFKT